MLAPALGAGGLVLLDFSIPAMRTSYSLIYLRNRTAAPATRAFLDILRDVEVEVTEADRQIRLERKRAPERTRRLHGARRARGR